LKRGPGLSYKVFFETADGPDSKHAKTLELAPDLTQTLADEIHSGTPPKNKLETKDRNANAAAYAAIITEVARAGITKEAPVLAFIRDCVEAQLELGPLRPVRKFVSEAIPIMPKTEKRVWLSIALVGYEVFLNNQTLNSETGTKLRAVKRFVREISACEKIGREQIRDQLKANDPSLTDAIIDCLISAGTIPKKLLGKLDQPASLYADEVTELGISIWLKSLRIGWKTRRNQLAYVRNFFCYLRDHLHAVPQTPKTVAHEVPLAKREAKGTPIAILWPAQVWTLLANLQDLDTVFYVALGVYAGLHTTEILKLDWDVDLVEKNGEFTQIFIASGQGKEDPKAPREGKFVKIRYPLNQILALGKGREGKIVTNGNVWGRKMRRLLKRLGILWSPSIMRHTTATFLNGIGVPLTEVADQLRDRLATVLKYYIRQLSNPDSEPMWTLPFEVSEFAKLKDRVREWDRRCQLKIYQPNGTVVIEPALPAVPASPPKPTVPASPPKPRAPRKRHPFRVWPEDPEFQVMLFEKTHEEIAAVIGCVHQNISYHAKVGGFDKPRHVNYWYDLKKGLPVKRPESYYKAKAQVEAAKAKKLATAQSN